MKELILMLKTVMCSNPNAENSNSYGKKADIC